MWTLLGCIGQYPLYDEPPVLDFVNGAAVIGDFVELEIEPGQELKLRLELHDPEGDPVTVWFPYVLGEMRFEPSGTTGVWSVPEFGEPSLTVILEDDRDPVARSEYLVLDIER